jgi:hypothetical protein
MIEKEVWVLVDDLGDIVSRNYECEDEADVAGAAVQEYLNVTDTPREVTVRKAWLIVVEDES